MPLLPPPLARIAMAILAAAALAPAARKPLFIPSTPAAARRATLPQTVFGGAAAAPAPASRAPPRCRHPLPNLPEIQ
jgi:hypothetical protein